MRTSPRFNPVVLSKRTRLIHLGLKTEVSRLLGIILRYLLSPIRCVAPINIGNAEKSVFLFQV